MMDWVEANLMFVTDQMSRADLVDFLLDNGLYKDSDFAYEYIDNLWALLRKRVRLYGRSAFYAFNRNVLVRKTKWTRVPYHAFCMATTMRVMYRDWSALCGDFIDQGALFEEVVLKSMSALGWTTLPVGWAGNATVVRLQEIVDSIAEELKDSPRYDLDIIESLNDAKADVLCYFSLQDERPGRPVFLLQCASGDNWKGKLGHPSLQTWGDMISFTAAPSRGLAIPFALDFEKEFRKHALAADGILLDRFRVLAPGQQNRDWVERDLQMRIIRWIRPRLRQLEIATV